MSTKQYPTQAVGLQQPFATVFPTPISAKRAPTTTDFAQIGTVWSYVALGEVWILASVIANVATWVNVAGGSGSFSTLTVTGLSTLAATTIVGTTNINASGAAVTTIGTGGTGAVNIGNATGNTAVTGSLTASVNVSATTGFLFGDTLYVGSDLGGAATTVGLTNVVNTSVSTGTLTIKGTTGNAGNSAGFIKAYNGVTAVYIPFFTVIAP